jgi:DNA gyrase subunit A
MSDLGGRILPISVEDEMKSSYIDYAMSVIVGRALPEVRDGLKPVHRRILYAIKELGLTHDKPHRKSARIVGDVLGKYHPHGDSSVYEAMVRMAQNFSTRYPLVDGHGNFGSVDGDAPAAMRYTEARLSAIASELLRDIDKETIDFAPNFDETLEEPIVLPSRFPNLLVNGSSGIAVGMATNIPPHNLKEVIDGIIMTMDDPDVSTKDLMGVIKGPDFPTGGFILGREGIKSAYNTGRGKIRIRAKAIIEAMAGGKNRIIVTEIPYQVNKAKLVEKIAELVRDKKIEGITDLRDESDRTGMRIVIELKREANPKIMLNKLYKNTQMELTFGVIMIALVNGEPKTLNLKEYIHHYLEHQKEIIIRRTKFDLRNAEEKAHILEGLRIALQFLDEVIALIRRSKDVKEAKTGLMEKFNLSDKQTQAILDLRLQKLTSLEREKIEEEYQQLLKLIEHLRSILGSASMVLDIIKKELEEIKQKYGDPRRTQITQSEENLEIEDLVEVQDVVITLTHLGYIKRLPLSTYRNQKRGGRGIHGLSTREEDFIEHIFITSTHHWFLFFTNMGKMFRLKVYELPDASRQAKGTAIINLLQLSKGERVTAIIPVKTFDDGYLFMGTKKGVVKKTVLSEFDSPRKGGLIAINIEEGDELIGVVMTDGSQQILMCTAQGKGIHFKEKDVRFMGRSARGVRGLNLSKNDYVVSFDTTVGKDKILIVTENGFGKRTKISDFRLQTRGGKGIISANVTDKTGLIIAVKTVRDDDEILLISANGIIIRTSVSAISVMGRATQGVTLMKTGEGDKVVAMAIAEKED